MRHMQTASADEHGFIHTEKTYDSSSPAGSCYTPLCVFLPAVDEKSPGPYGWGGGVGGWGVQGGV